MRAQVEVIPGADAGQFQVTVHDGGGRTTHVVTLRPESHRQLAPAATAEELIEASFHFLLDRESKESILRRFDLTVISHYFPDFDELVGDYLSA